MDNSYILSTKEFFREFYDQRQTLRFYLFKIAIHKTMSVLHVWSPDHHVSREVLCSMSGLQIIMLVESPVLHVWSPGHHVSREVLCSLSGLQVDLILSVSLLPGRNCTEVDTADLQIYSHLTHIIITNTIF